MSAPINRQPLLLGGLVMRTPGVISLAIHRVDWIDAFSSLADYLVSELDVQR